MTFTSGTSAFTTLPSWLLNEITAALNSDNGIDKKVSGNYIAYKTEDKNEEI